MPKSLNSLAVRMVVLLVVHHGKALRASLNPTGIERKWGDQWPPAVGLTGRGVIEWESPTSYIYVVPHVPQQSSGCTQVTAASVRECFGRHNPIC
uniref:Uncharacterized protein n=1 Tax=Leishmania RNA virus 1 TaxID=1678905 RepID=A0A2K5B4Q8_9VIRU|nr:hypothetical protein [Leishmania RNA virus 1]